MFVDMTDLHREYINLTEENDQLPVRAQES